jgi:NAD(P)-dependent dehydrogenase (short-subunit alcohol dehydrogenase family)
MASRAGTFGPPNMAAYAASKAGVIGLTRTASKDLAPYNVRVNSVGPALLGPGTMWQRQVEKQAAAGSQYFSEDPAKVEEQMINGVPMRRLGTHGEVASVVEFLMSEEASYITGVHIPIGGGLN